jgi:hypothetical protein
MSASKNQIGRPRKSIGPDAKRSQSEIDHASKGSPPAKPVKCSRARLEADRRAGPGQTRQASNGQILIIEEASELTASDWAVLLRVFPRAGFRFHGK